MATADREGVDERDEVAGAGLEKGWKVVCAICVFVAVLAVPAFLRSGLADHVNWLQELPPTPHPASTMHSQPSRPSLSGEDLNLSAIDGVAVVPGSNHSLNKQIGKKNKI